MSRSPFDSPLQICIKENFIIVVVEIFLQAMHLVVFQHHMVHQVIGVVKMACGHYESKMSLIL